MDPWDAISAGEEQARGLLAHRLTERLARTRFHLIANVQAGDIVLRCRPASLIDAIWQQFAREAAGIITARAVRRRTAAGGSSGAPAATTASTAHRHAGCGRGGRRTRLSTSD